MSFRPSQSRAAAAPTTAVDKNPVQGFLNVYVMTKTGERRKLGVLFLHSNSPVESKVAEKLAMGEAEAAEVIGKLAFVYNENNGQAAADDLDI